MVFTNHKHTYKHTHKYEHTQKKSKQENKHTTNRSSMDRCRSVGEQIKMYEKKLAIWEFCDNQCVTNFAQKDRYNNLIDVEIGTWSTFEMQKTEIERERERTGKDSDKVSRELGQTCQIFYRFV